MPYDFMTKKANVICYSIIQYSIGTLQTCWSISQKQKQKKKNKNLKKKCQLKSAQALILNAKQNGNVR